MLFLRSKTYNCLLSNYVWGRIKDLTASNIDKTVKWSNQGALLETIGYWNQALSFTSIVYPSLHVEILPEIIMCKRTLNCTIIQRFLIPVSIYLHIIELLLQRNAVVGEAFIEELLVPQIETVQQKVEKYCISLNFRFWKYLKHCANEKNTWITVPMKKIPEKLCQWNENFLWTLFLGTILLLRGYCNICSTTAKGISRIHFYSHI